MAHYGVYGAWCQNGRVVAIRKARGPYTGMLDLPGGSPEGDETSEETFDPRDHPESEFTPPFLRALTLLKDHGLVRSSGVSEPS